MKIDSREIRDKRLEIRETWDLVNSYHIISPASCQACPMLPSSRKQERKEEVSFFIFHFFSLTEPNGRHMKNENMKSEK